MTARSGFGRPAEWVAVVDFGGQYTQLIARRVRQCRVYGEIVPHDWGAGRLLAAAPRAVVLSGGPRSIYEEGAPTCDPALFSSGLPVLGICYGMHLMAHMLGGAVSRAGKGEYGRVRLFTEDDGRLFAGVSRETDCWMSHGDFVERLPAGFTALARTDNSPIAAMGDAGRRLFGVQFHPEVAHTPEGMQMLRNFLFGVAGCVGSWTMESFIEQAVADIRSRVGEGKVICALSGGVDSSVTAALVHRAVGERLLCVFVDHGLLRKGESESVMATFREARGMNVARVDARARFLAKLAGVADPERKRRVIGEEFIRVFEEEARRASGVGFLAQGTLYPDVIESGTAVAARIKTHHNVGGLPEDIALELIEPLRWLFKDEVRAIGEKLGLPREILWRQPFPGPGLAVRVIGEVTAERLALVREADAIVREEIEQAGLAGEVWQFFAVLPGLRTVGVMGDGRTYAETVAVRAVTSVDGMTADWARLPWDVLGRIASRLVNEVAGVNRVVYDISSKPPATIEWE